MSLHSTFGSEARKTDTHIIKMADTLASGKDVILLCTWNILLSELRQNVLVKKCTYTGFSTCKFKICILCFQPLCCN